MDNKTIFKNSDSFNKNLNIKEEYDNKIKKILNLYDSKLLSILKKNIE